MAKTFRNLKSETWNSLCLRASVVESVLGADTQGVVIRAASPRSHNYRAREKQGRRSQVA
jgi:hypothetical protein